MGTSQHSRFLHSERKEAITTQSLHYLETQIPDTGLLNSLGGKSNEFLRTAPCFWVRGAGAAVIVGLEVLSLMPPPLRAWEEKEGRQRTEQTAASQPCQETGYSLAWLYQYPGGPSFSAQRSGTVKWGPRFLADPFAHVCPLTAHWISQSLLRLKPH